MKNNIRIAIVGSDYQKNITNQLLSHCVETLEKHNILSSNIKIVRVPGSLEIPLAVRKLAKQKIFQAIIALGAIHKGKTYHFEQIANECIRGCMNVSWQYEIPVIYEVLAVYNIKDAMDRATRKKENRGNEAAFAALKMIEVLNKI